MKRQILAAFSLVAASVLVTGCASPSLQGDVYSRDEARQTQQVEYGIVVGVRPVIIEGESSVGGKVAGAVLGGVLGHQVGGGGGKDVATAVGVVAGSAVASRAQENASQAQGLELTIDMDSGRTISLVQEVQYVDQFREGDRVQINSNGRNNRVSRI